MRINVASAAGYRPGDTVSITREPNACWVGPEGIDTARYRRTPSDYAMLGTIGSGKFPPEEPAGMVQSMGQVTTPRSLYLQQFRDGRIRDSLAAGAGEWRTYQRELADASPGPRPTVLPK